MKFLNNTSLFFWLAFSSKHLKSPFFSPFFAHSSPLSFFYASLKCFRTFYAFQLCCRLDFPVYLYVCLFAFFIFLLHSPFLSGFLNTHKMSQRGNSYALRAFYCYCILFRPLPSEHTPSARWQRFPLFYKYFFAHKTLSVYPTYFHLHYHFNSAQPQL